MTTVLQITREPYNIFEDFHFMDILIEQDGKRFEVSIVEPHISLIQEQALPFVWDIDGAQNIQLTLFA